MADTICLVSPDVIRLKDADTIYLTCPDGTTTEPDSYSRPAYRPAVPQPRRRYANVKYAYTLYTAVTLTVGVRHDTPANAAFRCGVRREFKTRTAFTPSAAQSVHRTVEHQTVTSTESRAAVYDRDELVARASEGDRLRADIAALEATNRRLRDDNDVFLTLLDL